MRWFAKENGRGAPRHRYDGNNTWIRLEDSLVRQCQILDLSRTGVRLAVKNAHSIPNTFTLILSKNSSGRPARVKWRRGSEVGAEFFTPNPAPTSRLTADAAKAVKPPVGEGQKSKSSMSTVPSSAKRQQPDLAKLKVDARKAGSSSGEKAKTEAHSQTTGRGAQPDRTGQAKNSKRMDLSRLRKKLGRDHGALIHALKDIDPESPHGQELASIIESLNKTCD